MNTLRFISSMMIGLLYISVNAQSMIPSVVIRTNLQHRYPVPLNQVARTNITLAFDPYTNIWFEVDGSTDLVNWYWKTNIPVWQTNITFPMNQNQEFYRILTTNSP